MSLTIRISLAAALAVAGATASSSAAEKMSAPRCVAMDAKMMGHAMPELPAATGNIDRDFAAAMKSQMQAMVALEKFEVECGKREKAKAAARTMLEEDRQHLETLDAILQTRG
ncbi:MAG: hypothetical protein NVS4B5_03510 [Vulcanimicrobiaceae bacterium]